MNDKKRIAESRIQYGTYGRPLLCQYSHDDVSPLNQLPLVVPMDMGDLEEPPLQLQALGAAQYHLAAPLELEEVVQVPGRARMEDAQRI